MVHFVSAQLGWGITTGGLVQSRDGGKTWRAVDAPCGAEMVCFSDPSNGWLGVRNRIYRSDDGGSHWVESLAVPGWVATGHTTSLQCVRGGAWAYFHGQGAAMSHAPYVAYHATVGPWNPVMKEEMTGPAGVDAPGGGTYPAPMSAVSADTAVFLTYTPPGDPPIGMVLARRGGQALTPIRSLPTAAGNSPVSASFVTLDKGWVIVTDGLQWVILATSDGGTTWRKQART
jgi:photosystem II stability/assembly factor-like uncharacterized protein